MTTTFRDLWLSVAVAVARDGLPVPQKLCLESHDVDIDSYRDDLRVQLGVATVAELAAWLSVVEVADRWVSADGTPMAWGRYMGWRILLYSREKPVVEADPELVAQLAAALERAA